MIIAVEGCAHGELENIYNTIQLTQEKHGIKIDLLICCGDFQSTRNKYDLLCMAVPPKFLNICTFYKYYSGEKTAPVLTIFIGGNHEASNYLQELPYGGWVAPNIFYLGYAGVINIAGIRIAGLSGIYKSNDYTKGHFEKLPYDESSKRSVYHVRNLEVFRMKQLSGNVDIFLSHDWPSGVHKYGNVKQLLKKKPLFREDVERGELGSKACEDLLHHVKPRYWFAAHLHCKYAALVRHDNDSVTKFLALDKCLPKRKFMQIVEVPHDDGAKMDISYDLEWLTILYLTNHLLSVRGTNVYMPGPGINERYNFTPSEDEKSHVLSRFQNNLEVPKNFVKTAVAFDPSAPKRKTKHLKPVLNPQTVLFCEKLAVDDPVSQAAQIDGTQMDQSLSLTTSFIDESFETDSLNSSQTSPMKRLNLSLPDPKSEDNSEGMFDDSAIVEEDGESQEKLSTAEVSGIDAEHSEDAKEEEVMQTCDSPTPKKLKRRNILMYQNDEQI